jgi:hypothetical protein
LQFGFSIIEVVVCAERGGSGNLCPRWNRGERGSLANCREDNCDSCKLHDESKKGNYRAMRFYLVVGMWKECGRCVHNIVG